MVLVIALLSFVAASCAGPVVNIAPDSIEEPNYTVVLLSEVDWEQLNPARGDNSPMAATLWGDRTGPGPSGFLIKFEDGFKSPPHIHTADYHGVVISGAVHNAEPDAEEVYLPPASFWTQPRGGVHITAAKGITLAYIEFEGELDVLPAENAVDNETEAVVIHTSDITWADQPGLQASPDGVKLVELWSDPENDRLSGTLMKLPAGSTDIPINRDGSTFHAVVIQGQSINQVSDNTHYKTLEPGSYFGSEGDSRHEISCEEGEDCIIYLRREFKFNVAPEGLKD